jgi:hypothetical protein
MMSQAKSLVALVVAMVLLGLAACGGSQPAASLGGVDLTGVWKCDECPDFLQLNEDGTYAVAPIKPDFLEKAPADKGEFRLEGASFTFISSNESFICPSQAGSYQVELTELGQLQFILEEDACQERANFYPGTWSRYEP